MTPRMEDGETMLSFFRRMRSEASVSKGDLLVAGFWKRLRILQLTEDGLDFEGRPFAPYSSNGPYYYQPGNTGKREFRGQARSLRDLQKLRTFGRSYGADTSELDKILKNRKASAKRFYRKTTKNVTLEDFYQPKAGAVTGVSVKYESYGDFKFRGLGRTNVDLTGPRAPHMLQALVVSVDGSQFGNRSDVPLRGLREPADSVAVGIYGEEADRAEGHNEGAGRLPRRRFVDATDEDMDTMAEMVADRIVRRVLSRGGR